jgi:putative proteasome-type protease
MCSLTKMRVTYRYPKRNAMQCNAMQCKFISRSKSVALRKGHGFKCLPDRQACQHIGAHPSARYTLGFSPAHSKMTYCVAIKLNAGLVFLSDSRTNAGLDQISTFRKMIVYEKPDDRFMVLLSAGNLSISQSVREILQIEKLKDHPGDEGVTIWNAKSMFDAARVLGSAIRRVYERDAASLQQAGVDFNVSLIFGGQIRGEGMRLFQVYSAGNFIEATPETPFFQVGESKYGKPVLDRVITPNTPLDEAAKCALVSMDSTLKSNLSVGLPLDMVVYEANTFQSDRVVCIDENNPYFRMLHDNWGQKLREVFDSIEDPMWHGEQTYIPLMQQSARSLPVRKISSPDEKLI